MLFFLSLLGRGFHEDVHCLQHCFRLFGVFINVNMLKAVENAGKKRVELGERKVCSTVYGLLFCNTTWSSRGSIVAVDRSRTAQFDE